MAQTTALERKLPKEQNEGKKKIRQHASTFWKKNTKNKRINHHSSTLLESNLLRVLFNFFFKQYKVVVAKRVVKEDEYSNYSTDCENDLYNDKSV